MSSNRTIIPGMETPYNNPASEPSVGSSQQYAGGAATGGGTCVPNGVPNPMGEPVYSQPSQKPVVGFLYSISKTGGGEYWPVHIGSNTIGRSVDNDVCLQEGTVSEKHASLVVRVMKNPEKVIASICDSSSTIGTMINGESLGFDQRECFNGDILTIGAHYDLLLVLIDAKQIGLKVCPDFIPLQQARPQGFNFDSTRGSANPTVDLPGNNPYAPPTNPSVKRTRGFNDDGDINSGGTQGFPNNPNEPVADPKGGGRTIFM